MTYTGAMVLPQNAVVLHEEDMRYVDGGGWYARKKVSNLKKAAALRMLDNASDVCHGFAIGGVITGTALGAKIGGIPGSVVGAITGLIGGSIVWNFGTVFSSAYLKLKNIKCYKADLIFELHNFTLAITTVPIYAC